MLLMMGNVLCKFAAKTIPFDYVQLRSPRRPPTRAEAPRRVRRTRGAANQVKKSTHAEGGHRLSTSKLTDFVRGELATLPLKYLDRKESSTGL